MAGLEESDDEMKDGRYENDDDGDSSTPRRELKRQW